MVYRHRHANHVVIVEVKTTDHPLPRSLWPNVWAQLWVYSKISGIVDASHVVVLAEVWGQLADRLFLRRLIPRNPRREPFDAYFSQLFEIYRQHRERH